jgi:hypothetical protein
VDGTNIAFPDHEAIDAVFGFAKAADVKVIYSLRLLNGNPATDAATAQYIWTHYRSMLDCFAIGNEPDIKRYHYPPFGSGTDPVITNYSSFHADWRIFATAITNAVPGAVFAGPDAAARSWAQLFAKDEKNSGIVSLITQHYYVGGRPYVQDGPETIPVPVAIDNILSKNWVTHKYLQLYTNALTPVVADGLPYRLTESDDYLKGIANASDSFATALWALDYMHWWAAHGCRGVDFHNTEWLKTDTVFFDSSKDFRINPKALGIRAFDLGGHGRVEPIAISNSDGLNLTAYAVGDGINLYVTIINKEHGGAARDSAVTIVPNGFPASQAEAIFLTASNGDAGATNGITLGGEPITNDAPWRGQWTRINPGKTGEWDVTVAAASAVVVKISGP